MKFFHRTTRAAANRILAKGFRDRTGTYGFGIPLKGVWLSDIPLDMADGAPGDVLLEIDLKIDESQAAFYEVVEETPIEQSANDEFPPRYREWLMPAKFINQRCTMREVDQSEEFAIDEQRMMTWEAKRQSQP